MIKAINNAKGIEVSKEGEGILFVADFGQGTIMERTVPAIVLQRTWFAPESESFAEELSYTDTENDERIDIQLRTNGAFVFFSPAIEGHQPHSDFIHQPHCDLIVVPKDELVDILRKFLQ